MPARRRPRSGGTAIGPYIGLTFVLGMLAYGLKSGAIPALRVFLVFAFSFALAYTVKNPLYPRLRGLLRQTDPEWVEAISFLVPLFVLFVALMAVMLRYTRQSVPLEKRLNMILGGVTGVAAGLVLSGMAMVAVMTVPGWQGAAGAGHDWYFAPHQYVLRGYEYISRHLAGERSFDASHAVRDLEFARPEMPIGKSGIWVYSVPPGLRVYIAQARARQDPADWKRELEIQLRRSESPVRIEDRDRRRRRIEGYLGRTPVFAPVDVQNVMLAVEMPLPEGMEDVGEESPFYWDGEVGWWTQEGLGEKVLVKVYRLDASGGRLATLISTFIPPGEEGAAQYEAQLPVREGFDEFFDEDEVVEMFPDAATAQRYKDWLRRGGKAVFEEGDEIRVLEVTGQRTVSLEREPIDHRSERLGR